MRTGLLIFLLLSEILLVTTRAQDINFSLANGVPVYINPASTGDFNGEWRVTVINRDQWRTADVPFRTLMAGYDQQIYYQDYHVSGGLYLISDNAGVGGLNRNMVYGTGAFHHKVHKQEYHAGIQVGYAMVTYPDHSLPSSYDVNSGTHTVVPGSMLGDPFGYLDVNIGGKWRMYHSDFTPEVGASIFHVNFPKESTYGEKEIRSLRYMIHGQLEYDLSELFYVTPLLICNYQKMANYYYFGSLVNYRIRDEFAKLKELQAGVYMRDGILTTWDSFVFSLGAKFKNLAFDIGYDFDVSPMNQVTNYHGAFEISIRYINPGTVFNNLSIPCERL